MSTLYAEQLDCVVPMRDYAYLRRYVRTVLAAERLQEAGVEARACRNQKRCGDWGCQDRNCGPLCRISRQKGSLSLVCSSTCPRTYPPQLMDVRYHDGLATTCGDIFDCLQSAPRGG